MFPGLIEKLRHHQDLTTDESADAMAAIMAGDAAPAQIAGLLIGLSMKGEQPSELVGFARTMRRNAVSVPRSPGLVFDTCGTGGDRSGSFNISTAAAIVVAACGVRVAKHGNRSVSSQCGSADVLEALGVNILATPAVVANCLERAGIAFLFAPTFHPAMRHAGPARRDLGVRTAFNLLGPLTNPAGPARQLIGVPRPDLTELLARTLGLLGSERAWVVHGADGLDELSTTGYTKVSEWRDGSVQTFYVHPADFGLPKARARNAQGRRCRHQCRHRSRRAGWAGRPAPRRRPSQCRRGALRRRRGRDDRRRHRAERRRHRQRRGARRPASTRRRVATTGRDGEMNRGSPDLLEAIVAATRTRVASARARESHASLERRALARQPDGRAVHGRLVAAPAA